MHVSQFLNTVTVAFDDGMAREFTEDQAKELAMILNAHFARRNRENHISTKLVPDGVITVEGGQFVHVPSSHDVLRFDKLDTEKPSDS